MKLNAALMKTLLMAASIGVVVPVLADTSAKANASKGKTGSAKPAEEPKADEAEPVIPGTVINRKNGGFLGLTLEGGGFKLSFYDGKKKPVAVDAARAALHWKPNYKVGEERDVLNPSGDNLSLSSPRPVRPPYTFKLFITLLSEDDKAIESFVVDFRG
jgi:hypothetical protein